MKLDKFIVFFSLVFLFLAGCGGASGARAHWASEPMPEGGDFDGVYQSDFGRLELTVQGNDVVGLYQDDVRQVFGRIEGTVNGNLLHFNWTQRIEDMQGKARDSKGRGVWRYVITEEQITDGVKQVHTIEGTWGYDQDERGNVWGGRKLNRSKKSLKVYSPDKTEMEKGPSFGSAGFDGAAPATEQQPAESTVEDKKEDKKEDTSKDKKEDKGKGKGKGESGDGLDGLF